jgi:hypothetical protein
LSRLLAEGRLDAELFMRLAAQKRRASVIAGVFDQLRPETLYRYSTEMAQHMTGSVEDRLWLSSVLTSQSCHGVLWIKNQFAEANGLTLAEPFTDGELLLFMSTVPARIKLRYLTNKYVSKRYLRRYLPRRVVMNTKVSNRTSYRVMLESGATLRRLCEEIRDFDYSGLVPGMSRYVASAIAHAESADRIDGDLLSIINFHIWYHSVVKDRNAVVPRLGQ